MKNTKKNIAARSKVKTNAKRAVYDSETIYKILDDSFICHIGFVIDNQPFVIPTCYGREGDNIFFHGSAGSRMLNHVKTGNEICIAVTHLDGIVLARSAFHHSINYRSVIIFGKADEITETNEKTKALKIITEHILPGRWDDARKPDEKELNITSVFSVKINEASAKIRTGGPVDDKKDMQLNIWAGVLPLKITSGKPEKDPLLTDDIQLPFYIKKYKKNV